MHDWMQVKDPVLFHILSLKSSLHPLSLRPNAADMFSALCTQFGQKTVFTDFLICFKVKYFHLCSVSNFNPINIKTQCVVDVIH